MEEKGKKPRTSTIIVSALAVIGLIVILLWTFVINPLIHGGWVWLLVILGLLLVGGIYSIRHPKD